MKKFMENQTGHSAMVIIIAIVVVAALAVFYVLRVQKEEPIKIGSILTLSGSGEYYGKEARDGMIMAVDEINSWGGINGRKIELIIEDSKTSPEEGKRAFNRIEADHHPLLYISTTSFVSVPLTSLSEASKVLLVGLTVAAPEFTEEKEWVFRYYQTAENEAAHMLLILEELRVKDLGIMYSNEAFGTSVCESLKERFEKTGGTVKKVALGMNEVDFRKQIAKLKDVEAICIIGYKHHLENAFKQLKRAKFEGDIIAGPAASAPSIKGIPQANGVYIAAPIVYNPNFLFAKKLKDKYEVIYNKPFNHFAAHAYDFIKLMAGLLEDKEVTRESVKSVLEEGFIYPGVFGDLNVKRGQHDVTFPFHAARIVDGEVKYLR